MINKGPVEKTLTAQEVQQYLQRLNYSGDCSADIQTLTNLHRAHMENVPFENLDIVLGHEIKLLPAALFAKVVNGKRGGFCYEVNFLFASLLSALGFEVYLHAARVYGKQGYGPAFDHMLLSVRLGECLYIADVGFGDSFITPLCLMQGQEVGTADSPAGIALDCLNRSEVRQGDVSYKVAMITDMTTDGLVLMQQKPSQQWQRQYLFSLQAFELIAFNDMCHYHQTSPKSSFTQKSVCSVATACGRKTISGNSFIETIDNKRYESEIADQDNCRELLLQHFGISLPQDISDSSWHKLLINNRR
ncbi:arylamine N-acetyltransferase [Thalassomonas viridans]|uniref:Arylamine N-acetyltransferase n=1 Tax=Thalassomonas viridans TaxID=137584 RepID=A0AAE9Z742_9GAMM|nr:arylamine N-acetyltransferase [Thalassomonas viridans]WDE07976.1 arylamine N-acetyltransferase [Thalassomonas viridans]